MNNEELRVVDFDNWYIDDNGITYEFTKGDISVCVIVAGYNAVVLKSPIENGECTDWKEIILPDDDVAFLISKARRAICFEEAEKLGVSLDIIDDIETNRQSSLWYSGWVADAEYKSKKYRLMAYGYINARLYDDKGDEIAVIRGNGDAFYHEMASRISSDNELYALKDANNLVFDNNNWWEVVSDSDIDEWVCDADNIYDAIAEMINGIVKINTTK